MTNLEILNLPKHAEDENFSVSESINKSEAVRYRIDANIYRKKIFLINKGKIPK